MPHIHVPFATYAAVLGIAAALIIVPVLAGPVRRRLARLAEALVIGAAVAFGVTAYVDGQHHAALAAAARHGARAAGASTSLAAAFTVITAIVAVLAYTILAAAARHRRDRAQRQMLAAADPYQRAPRGRARAW